LTSLLTPRRPCARRCSPRRHELRRLDRFRHLHLEACAKCTRSVLGTGERSERDGRQPAAARFPEGTHAPQRFVTIDAGHANVAHEHVRSALLDDRQGRFTGRRHEHVGVAIAQYPLQQQARVRFIIDDQHGDARQVERLEIDRQCARMRRFEPQVVIGCAMHGGDRQPERERGAAIGSGALCARSRRALLAVGDDRRSGGLESLQRVADGALIKRVRPGGRRGRTRLRHR
jgi:hypothetical protein